MAFQAGTQTTLALPPGNIALTSVGNGLNSFSLIHPERNTGYPISEAGHCLISPFQGFLVCIYHDLGRCPRLSH